MPTIANWLRPADVLGAMSSGAGLGLQQRAANQRDAEMAQRMQLAEMENARQQESAAEQLMYHRDALAQARDLALRDDDYRTAHDERAMEQMAAKLLQDKAEADALSQYRNGLLNNSKTKIDEKDALEKREEEQTIGLTNALTGGADLSSALLKFPYASKSLRTDLVRDLNSQRVTERLDKRHDNSMNRGTETFDVDAVKESPAQDAYSGLLGTGLFSHPARPAVQARPAMKVTRPVSTSAIDALNAPMAQAPAPVATPAEPKSGEADAIRAEAIQKLKTAPSKRKEILKRLIDAGISVEGL